MPDSQDLLLGAPYPILEHDPAPEAVIEPTRVIRPIDIPECAVLCFFQDVITAKAAGMRVIKHLVSEIGPNPIYELAFQGRHLAIVHPGVGAPLAAAFLEELIALGCRKFIACGGAGVLDGTIAPGHVIVPSVAVRDEGTSYHYLPPGREAVASRPAVTAIENVLQSHHVPYVVAKTWTTDAIYRETPEKVRLRRSEGCLAVEMEAAALFAVAQFRGVTFGQLLYGGDDVSSERWDARDWQSNAPVREKLFHLAMEACLAL